jgi:hypothetical protein
MHTLSPPADLLEVVEGMRRIHERLVESALKTDEVEGTCFYGAHLLRDSIEQFTPFAAVIRGGDGEGDGGYMDFTGRMHGHYWVEAWPKGSLARGEVRAKEAWTADITSDQFGGPAVVLMPVVFSLARWVAGDQSVVDEHVVEQGVGIPGAA